MAIRRKHMFLWLLGFWCWYLMKMPQSCSMRHREPSEWIAPLLTPTKEKCQQEIQARELFPFSHGRKHSFGTVKRKEEWEIFWFNTCSEPPPPSLPAWMTHWGFGGWLAHRGMLREHVIIIQSLKQGLEEKPPLPTYEERVCEAIWTRNSIARCSGTTYMIQVSSIMPC